MSGMHIKVIVPCPLAGVDCETKESVQLGLEAIV